MPAKTFGVNAQHMVARFSRIYLFMLKAVILQHGSNFNHCDVLAASIAAEYGEITATAL